MAIPTAAQRISAYNAAIETMKDTDTQAWLDIRDEATDWVNDYDGEDDVNEEELIACDRAQASSA